jgi:hypothetical protein
VPVPLVVVGVNGVKAKDAPPGKAAQDTSAPRAEKKSGGFLSRLFGNR